MSESVNMLVNMNSNPQNFSIYSINEEAEKNYALSTIFSQSPTPVAVLTAATPCLYRGFLEEERILAAGQWIQSRTPNSESMA